MDLIGIPVEIPGYDTSPQGLALFPIREPFRKIRNILWSHIIRTWIKAQRNFRNLELPDMDMVRIKRVVPDDIIQGLVRSSVLERNIFSYGYEGVVLEQGTPGVGNVITLFA